MKKISAIVLCFHLIMLVSSCSTSRIGVGLSADKGNFRQRSQSPDPNAEPRTAKGTGAYVEYRWQKMKKRHGYGIDANFQLNGYGDDADGDPFFFQTLQGKYYFTLSPLENKNFRMDAAAGLGFGEVKSYGDRLYRIIVYNFSFDFHFPKNHFLYLTTKANFVRHPGEARWGTKSVGLQIGLGARLRK